MKYLVISGQKNGTGDLFTSEYNTQEEAIKAAEYALAHLTDREKEKTSLYVLESANPDEEAENHFDGNIVKQYL